MFIKDNQKRIRKQAKIRKKISGTPEKPRLAVFRSLNQIYAQMIDDVNGLTLAEASTKSKEILEDVAKAKGKVAKSKLVGTLIAKRAGEKGITTVVFDRGGYNYHGRVKALADGAREGGLKF